MTNQSFPSYLELKKKAMSRLRISLLLMNPTSFHLFGTHPPWLCKASFNKLTLVLFEIFAYDIYIYILIFLQTVALSELVIYFGLWVCGIFWVFVGFIKWWKRFAAFLYIYILEVKVELFGSRKGKKRSNQNVVDISGGLIRQGKVKYCKIHFLSSFFFLFFYFYFKKIIFVNLFFGLN